MDTWTRQMGYPVINVIPDGNFYRLEQSRFLYNYNATDTDDSPYRYCFREYSFVVMNLLFMPVCSIVYSYSCLFVV